jgi:hypothetical protein
VFQMNMPTLKERFEQAGRPFQFKRRASAAKSPMAFYGPRMLVNAISIRLINLVLTYGCLTRPIVVEVPPGVL